jgi:hypothetical protein
MSMTSRLLKRADDLLSSGKPEDARRALQAVIREEPENRLAWSLFSGSLSNDNERIEALEDLLNVCPGNQRAVKALAVLRAQRERQAYRRIVRKEDSGERNYRILFYTALTLLLMVTLCCVGGTAFIANNNPWQEEVESLSTRYSALLDEFNVLRESFNDLSDEHQLLQNQHAALRLEYNELLGDFNALLVQYESLQQDYSSLVSEYNWLRSIAVTPPYILIDGRTTYIRFVKLDQSIVAWQVPFESLEVDIRRGHTARHNLFSQLGSKTKLSNAAGEVFSVTDYRTFVDPNPFREVIPGLYYEAGTEDAFIKEVWNIVTQLSTYSSEIEDTPRYPLETFLAGGGDCEDTSILFASMIKAAPIDWKVDLVYMDSHNPLSPQEINHVMVHINTGREDYCIETTSEREMEPFSQVMGWYLEVE